MAQRKPHNGVHIEPWCDPGVAIGYRAARYARGKLVEVLYSEAVSPGSPAGWLLNARRNAILAVERSIVNPK